MYPAKAYGAFILRLRQGRAAHSLSFTASHLNILLATNYRDVWFIQGHYLLAKKSEVSHLQVLPPLCHITTIIL